MTKTNLLSGLTLVLALITSGSIQADPVVPGTGQKLNQVGDDFENPNWSFIHNFPKSSEEIDERRRGPTGKSTNGRWYEGIKRGQPDFMKVVPSPEDGLSGSQHSLLMRTLKSGVPGRRSGQMQQDDLIVNCYPRLGGPISVSQNPNCTVRVYVPPFEEWEDRSGPSFGFRIAVETHAWTVPEEKKKSRGFFGGRPKKEFAKEVYWPGMFIQFRNGAESRHEADSAFFTIRGKRNGADFKGPEITEPGWWTLGMSVSGDGMVHYYISQGVDDLTAEDFVTSQLPYSYKAERFRTCFFNVCNRDDGRTWSTPWIIDDPSFYIGSGRLATRKSNRR
ncbi:MAG: hypothetical protein P8N76_08425 [Pirellulaceae bacterium]|nr:hypothetical protein [Pirellulaceae bacterium]